MNWISVKLAASLMGYKDVDYFRRVFCDERAPILTLNVRQGPKGRRRILVLEASVLAQVQSQIRHAS